MHFGSDDILQNPCDPSHLILDFGGFALDGESGQPGRSHDLRHQWGVPRPAPRCRAYGYLPWPDSDFEGIGQLVKLHDLPGHRGDIRRGCATMATVFGEEPGPGRLHTPTIVSREHLDDVGRK